MAKKQLFSPLKLLKTLKNWGKLRGEMLFDAAPQTPQFYTEGAVRKLLSGYDRVAVVGPDFPYDKLAAPDFTLNTPEDREHIKTLQESIRKAGLRVPPMLGVQPVAPDDMRPTAYMHDGRHRFKALNWLEMDKRPIGLDGPMYSIGDVEAGPEYIDQLLHKYKKIIDQEGYRALTAKRETFKRGGGALAVLKD